jgi:hypothetical protein
MAAQENASSLHYQFFILHFHPYQIPIAATNSFGTIQAAQGKILADKGKFWRPKEY